MRITLNHCILFALLLIIALPRLFDLGGFLTADEKRWLARTVGFTDHLAHGELDQLLLAPHPGITTQWLASPTIYADSPHVQKLALAISQCVLIASIGYLFWRLWGQWPAVLLTTLLALNPLLTAHTRIVAMDALLSLFLLISIGCLLVWEKYRQPHYIALAGGATAAAILSKLPGVLIIPYTGLFLLWHWYQAPSKKVVLKAAAWWLVAFIVAALLILPSIALDAVDVYNEILSFFASDEYQEIHQEGTWYYIRSLFFFSTPLQLLALVALMLSSYFFITRRSWQAVQPSRKQLIWLSLFALLFLAQMTLGDKKGDRYILPVFVLLDCLTVIAAMWALHLNQKKKLVIGIIMVGIIWQAGIIWYLHPYALAYVNPITKPWFGDQRLGWGEGLDLAAMYLNAKPSSDSLKAASYYPAEFAANFKGETVPAHQHDEESIDYVVLYRAMYDRGPTAWETDVAQQYQQKTPEKVIFINNLEYVWIYKK